jgi:hypothetical protein
VRNDLKAMKATGVDLCDREEFPDVLGILDTFKIAKHLEDCRKLNATEGLGLESFLDCLEIPFSIPFKILPKYLRP